MKRIEAVRAFYEVLDKLEKRMGGLLRLANCTGRLSWPRRGVYFFFENGEVRSHSGSGLRVVRVGTHALSAATRTTLWKRLSQHRGTLNNGSGNHRGSIFRLLLGEAIMRRNGSQEPNSWGIGGTASDAVKRVGVDPKRLVTEESELERAVSRYIGAMPFLFVGAEDDPGPNSARGVIERHAIALLSNYQRPSIDPHSRTWLGLSSGRERVRGSGLWNNRHVDEAFDEGFLDVLAAAAAATSPLTR